MGKFEPVKCHVWMDRDNTPVRDSTMSPLVYAKPCGDGTAPALLVPAAPRGHEWVCVQKKPKRKGTRKVAGK